MATPSPTVPSHDLGGYRVNWIQEYGILLFPIIFMAGCLVIRMIWGCCASIYGWGNRGRPPVPRPPTPAEEVLNTQAAPFDWVIESFTGQNAAGTGTGMDDLLVAGKRSTPWVEQWSEAHKSWYYWNTDTAETVWERPPGFAGGQGGSPAAPVVLSEEDVLHRQRVRLDMCLCWLRSSSGPRAPFFCFSPSLACVGCTAPTRKGGGDYPRTLFDDATATTITLIAACSFPPCCCCCCSDAVARVLGGVPLHLRARRRLL